MSTDPSPYAPPPPGTIRFHQAAPPSLPPGDYTIKVTQTLAGAKGDSYASQRGSIENTFTTESAFAVAGPRFYLKPAEIYSVYPPLGETGPYDNALPHVVFTRRTLPWERSLDGKRQDPAAPVPWLALLTLARTDFADGKLPQIAARQVGELLSPGGEIQGPDIQPRYRDKTQPRTTDLYLESGQTTADLCNTLDLPVALFAQVAPALEDLPFLAHVREVNTGGKETLSLQQDGWFTVVLGNRLPATQRTNPTDRTTPASPRIPGETNLVCLVSLEGLGAVLPKVDADGRAAVPLLAGKTHVRLAVLAFWSFTCHGNNDFKTRMVALRDKTSLLTLPSGGLDPATAGHDTVERAFRLGYTGLNHTTRVGEKTVSWYRGPLVPVNMDPKAPYAFIPCADAALRYDFRNGMFAAEYAAAFELGRLMALQNRGFASAIYHYRRRVAQDLAAEQRRADLEAALSLPADYRGSRGPRDPNTGYQSFVPRGRLSDTVAQMMVGRFGTADATGDATTPPAPAPTAGVSFDPPPEVQRFLARAVLLYGVPFHYLVPEERMLPPDSIRFFYLDPGWIATLIQGATSTGRLAARDTMLDEHLRYWALAQAMGDAAGVREKPAVCTEPTTAAANWPLTGFLLRSPVVAGWQGLEMRAYADAAKTTELAPLRIDRLAPDILLCLFNGKVNKLTVQQPPEGLHFGLSPVGDGKYQRLSVRKVTAASSEADLKPGAQILPGGKAPPPIDIAMRLPANASAAPTRVFNVTEVAKQLATKLAELGQPTGSRAATEWAFTSAEFGVEMVESPGRVEFSAPDAPPSTP